MSGLVNTQYSVIEFIIDLYALIIILVISIILIIKIIKERRESGAYNIIRILILGVFISLTWALLWEFIYENTLFRIGFPDETAKTADKFSFYNLGTSLIVTFALTMVFYYNQWKRLYFIPFFTLIVLLTILLISGFGLILLIYIYSGGIFVLVIMIYNSFKLRDNNLLGLCIFFIFAFLTNILGDSLVGLIFNLIYPTFGLIFVLGYFKPFKEETIS